MTKTLTSLSDAHAVEPDRLFLRPLTVLAPADRVAARVGGGWAGFDSVEVMLRGPTGMVSASGSLNDVALWSRHQGRDVARHVDSLLARITDPRPAFAGVAMDQPRIMGIVNVTPDSFSDGGDFAAPEAGFRHARALVRDGARFLDIGGESTRPGSDSVDPDTERRRVVPVIKVLDEAKTGAVISIDTRKAALMKDAVAAGATVVNDISALTYDADALATVAALGVHVILMHCQGDPKTMQDKPVYGHAPTEIFDYLAARVIACENAGIPRTRIAVDPGIGFGKGLDHNLSVMADLALFHGLGCPVLVGASRKSFIGHLAGITTPRDRGPGSLSGMLWAVGQGVQMVRVHDVAAAAQALAVWQGIAANEG